MRLAKLVLAVVSLTILSSGSAYAQQSNKIVLGTGQVMPSALLLMALKEDLFEKAGLNVESIQFASGQRALEALLGGQLDLTFVAEYPPLIANMRNQPFGIIATVSKYNAFRVIGRADRGFKKIEDLAGKRIGTTLATNVGYLTESTLKDAGIKAQVVSMGPAAIVPALSNGDIDAGVMFPPFYGKARDALGDNYREQIIAGYQSYFFIAATKQMIEERSADLKSFVSALLDAEKSMKTNPDEAKSLIVDASRGVLDLAAVEKSWPEYKYEVGFDERMMEILVSEAEWTKEKDIIPDADASRSKVRSMFFDQPLRSLAPERVTLPQ